MFDFIGFPSDWLMYSKFLKSYLVSQMLKLGGICLTTDHYYKLWRVNIVHYSSTRSCKGSGKGTTDHKLCHQIKLLENGQSQHSHTEVWGPIKTSSSMPICHDGKTTIVLRIFHPHTNKPVLFSPLRGLWNSSRSTTLATVCVKLHHHTAPGLTRVHGCDYQ